MVQAGLSDALIVQVTASGKHWQCTMPSFHAGSFLYINRRTGAWKRSFLRPLSADGLAAL